MLRFGSEASPTPVFRLLDLIAHWNLGNPLEKSLADYSDDELDEILAATGKSRADLFAVIKGNARHRQFMGLMMKHFGVDHERATKVFWKALKSAEQACIECTHTKRCRSWLGWGSKNDAPRIFCPCAPLYDEIARAMRGSQPPAMGADDSRGKAGDIED